MLSRLCALITGLLILCTALIGGTRALARRHPPSHVAAVLPDDRCRAPCWQGLRPGTIDPDALHRWLSDPPHGWQAIPVQPDGSSAGVIDSWQIDLPDAAPLTLTVERVHPPQVDRLIVSQADLTLGDVIAALGEPDFIDFYLDRTLTGTATLSFRLYYRESRVIAGGLVVPGADKMAHLWPYTPVEALVYEAEPWARPVLAFDWRGFGSTARYYPGGVLP
jgi:hypothetical protein